MTAIEMLKELIENGGKFETDSNRYWFVTKYSSGKIVWKSKTNHQKDEVVELTNLFLSAIWNCYEEPVDWSKVPVDTKVVCAYKGEKHNRHFAFVKNGKPHVWHNGRTSHSAHNGVTESGWDSVELHEQAAE